MQDTDDPANQNQNSTELRVHDDYLVEGVADVRKVVIGHCCLEEVNQTCKEHEEKKKKTPGRYRLHRL